MQTHELSPELQHAINGLRASQSRMTKEEQIEVVSEAIKLKTVGFASAIALFDGLIEVQDRRLGNLVNINALNIASRCRTTVRIAKNTWLRRNYWEFQHQMLVEGHLLYEAMTGEEHRLSKFLPYVRAPLEKSTGCDIVGNERVFMRETVETASLIANLPSSNFRNTYVEEYINSDKHIFG